MLMPKILRIACKLCTFTVCVTNVKTVWQREKIIPVKNDKKIRKFSTKEWKSGANKKCINTNTISLKVPKLDY